MTQINYLLFLSNFEKILFLTVTAEYRTEIRSKSKKK